MPHYALLEICVGKTEGPDSRTNWTRTWCQARARGGSITLQLFGYRWSVCARPLSAQQRHAAFLLTQGNRSGKVLSLPHVSRRTPRLFTRLWQRAIQSRDLEPDLRPGQAGRVKPRDAGL